MVLSSEAPKMVDGLAGLVTKPQWMCNGLIGILGKRVMEPGGHTVGSCSGIELGV